MKDITIKGKWLKRELIWFAGCLVVAFGINVAAVIIYSRPAIELLSQLGFVVVIAIALYVAAAIVRLAVWPAIKGIRALFKKHNQQTKSL